jgi:hypothetical protein
LKLGLYQDKKRSYAELWLNELEASRDRHADSHEARMNMIKLAAAIAAAVATVVLAIVGVMSYFFESD